jgi:hypothetical protein
MKIFSPILKGTTTVAQGTTNLSGSFTGSLLGTASTASYADNFTVGGTLTAQTINVQIITSSIEFNTGSTRNGSSTANTHQFTGSVLMSGSLTVNNGNTLSIYRPDNARALQFYTTINECIIDSWEATGEPLHIRSNGGNGRIQFFTSGSERIRITPAGNVGIGTTAPLVKLNTFISDDLSAIQIRAETFTSNVLSYTGIAPSILEYYRNADTGVDLTIQTKIGAAGSGGNIVFAPNSPSVNLTPVERMRITKAGSVGIGTTSPNNRLEIRNDVNGDLAFWINNRAGTASGTSNSIIFGGYRDAEDVYAVGKISVLHSGGSSGDLNHKGDMVFYTQAANPSSLAERMRITGAGLVQITSAGSLTNSVQIYPSAAANTSGTSAAVQINQSFTVSMDTISSVPYGVMGGDSANGGILFRTYNGGYAYRFYFYANGTAYNSTGTWGNNSDIKLKQDIVDASSQWDDIKSLNFKKYRLKKDVQNELNSTDGFIAPTHFGLIAQDVEQTSPGLVEEIGDEDGGTTKMLKTSVMLMKSVKALQEAMARIETLEERLTALENN